MVTMIGWQVKICIDMCEFCDKIRIARINKTIYDSDRRSDYYGSGWASYTSPMYTGDDMILMRTCNDIKFCPKCGSKL